MSKLKAVLSEIDAVLDRMDTGAIADTAEKLAGEGRIFVVGEGRSGLMAKSFAMRMMHLGAEIFAVGETITPSMAAEDTLVAVSGSGTTKNVLWVAERAKELGCRIIAVTANGQSPLGECATDVLHLPAATKYRREGEAASIQPLGSLFDQCVHLALDAVCLEYAALRDVDHHRAFQKHSNVE
ncbi:6-phospho-3-hexuloisomerase [Paenibacillus filicis]|uniref:6-phospho-3-hexuloisomerase n=1 Tax=Paenibacillus gyeongsangnamensis TaxID=3388067 RepID=A0ABT4QCE2_9BACL|nr:6-phospho-3-hexuloisomerase [Paenibacillus filicis]MCZ8514483.1 6-phospho-3-hexuloisomerase [Paenibacillus filicis]